MKSSRPRSTIFSLLFASLFLLELLPTPLLAQTATTGELSGIVIDASGAVVSNASVTLKSVDTGRVQPTQTNATGFYKFSLLQPGTYVVSAIATGFAGSEKRVQIGLGSSAAVNLQLEIGSGHITVEVSAMDVAVESEDGNLNTIYNAKQLEVLPNPGNDLSAVAFTVPGSVINTAGGAANGGGNVEMYGLPATSNVFTVDGANYNDPYFNVNNSGATNLTLGLNEIQESAVVANGYSGSYGGAAGANLNFVTKSGTNQWHGNAIYWWNGSLLNANNYFNNQQGQPRPFVNANQFAGSVGGPIVKDKSFFFFDYEGLYLAVPVPNSVNVPTAAFENAVIGSLNATGMSASVPFYNTMFGLYNGVSRAGATAVSGGGCDDATLVNGIVFGPSNPCALTVQVSPTAKTHDVFYSGRYDQTLGASDRMFLRVEHEHGLQATITDPINSVFNAISDQPQWQANVQETHTFGSDKVNVFNASFLWYGAIFKMANPSGAVSALTTLPGQTESLSFYDGTLTDLNGNNVSFPQGRNITQYQFVDDFSWIRGRHNLKVGVNFRRDDISDHTFTRVTPTVVEFSLGDFATGGGNGAGNEILQNFPLKTAEPIALYQLGFYGADDVRITNNLKLTLSLRMDHLSNPVCQTNCFQRLAGTFGQLDTSKPVNQAILVGQHQAFPSVTAMAFQPKIGFAWSPFGGARNTVIRGGIGVFADSLPTGAVDSFMAQAPNDPRFSIFSAPLSPAEPGNLYVASQAANATFRANYLSGGAVPRFAFTNATAMKVPRYYEWSLELQQGLGWNTTLSTIYVGNRGMNEEISNGALNAFSTTPFADLPTGAPDPRFRRVSSVQNIANSNYNGLSVSLKHSSKGGLTLQAAYTWSHSLDEISNNSLAPFGVNTTGLYADIINPQDPSNVRKYNYGNSDYDIRHNFVMSYVWNDSFRHLTHWGPGALMKGWTFSGTLFRHSGLPFTVVSSNVTSALSSSNYGGTQQVFADVLGSRTGSCGASAAQAATPCLLKSNFSDPTNNWGQQRRNQYRGPGYFNTDFGVEKAFGIQKWERAQFSVGARFYNAFNHPNFNFPVMNLDSPQFGQILQTVSSPTSVFGSGLGADASPRLIQLQAKFTF